MRTIWLAMLVAAAPIAVDRIPARAGAAQAPGAEAEKAAAAFLQAFLAADAPRMKDHFADRIRIDGDMRFLTPAADGTVTRDGDFVYDLHFREALRGQRSDLDEAILFVFRDVGGKLSIVGHYADY